MNKNNLTIELNNKEIENIIRRSYQYVAMLNVNNKFALSQVGWNTVKADTQLKDHTMTDIARPNNDTLYIGCMLDLRADAVILDIPAIVAAIVIAVVSALIVWLAGALGLSLGGFLGAIVHLIIAALVLIFAGNVVKGLKVKGFVGALIAAVAIAVVSWLINGVVGLLF